MAYGRPANLFVADFPGSPPIDLNEGKLITHENAVYLAGETLSILTGLPLHMVGRAVLGAIWPEDVKLSSIPSPEATVTGTVYSALPAGPETIVQVEEGIAMQSQK